MTRLNVNPTRMVMANLKTRLAVSKRGYSLLKDKQDELMRRFIQLAKENRAMRKEVEEALHRTFASFSMASAVMSPEMLENALRSSRQKLLVGVEVENVMSVRIPRFHFERVGHQEGEEASTTPYGYVQTSPELDLALEELNAVMDRLLELTRIEKSAQLMADEIEATRRRVNALEYRTIPDLEETISYIRMKLDEEDRSTITRLLKIKDLISQAKEGRDDINARLQTDSVVEKEDGTQCPPEKVMEAPQKRKERKMTKGTKAEKAAKEPVKGKGTKADTGEKETEKAKGTKAEKKSQKAKGTEKSKAGKKTPDPSSDHIGVVARADVAASDTLSEATKAVIALLQKGQ